MYLPGEVIVRAFALLPDINRDNDDDRPDHTGKRLMERVSSLRYLLAALDTMTQFSEPRINLRPSSPHREHFIGAVGRVVALDNELRYTKDFNGATATDRSYSTSSNYLTTRLKTDGIYPGRRGGNMLIQHDQTLTLHQDWLSSLSNLGTFESYRVALAIWLCRNEQFEKDGESISTQINQILSARYGDALRGALIRNDDDLASWMRDIELSEEIFTGFLPEEETSAEPSDVGQNVILCGAPGTGKSFAIDQFQPFRRTVFHPDYYNSDFIGQLQPLSIESEIKYSFWPGPLTECFIYAFNNPSEHIWLAIEELNRGNASAIFGEVFQLLDRDHDGRSKYSVSVNPLIRKYITDNLQSPDSWEGELFLPANLSIIASLNTSDQSTYPLDTAFKRRWRLQYLPIDFAQFDQHHTQCKPVIQLGGSNYSWVQVAQAINILLAKSGIREDALLGPYFMSHAELHSCEKDSRIFVDKVLLYLWYDVLQFGQRDLIFDTTNFHTFAEISQRSLGHSDVFNRKFIELLNSKTEVV